MGPRLDVAAGQGQSPGLAAEHAGARAVGALTFGHACRSPGEQCADTPPDDCCVRAQALRTYWRLTAKPDGGTHVEVEVLTDPKGMLPAWVVNLVQRGWPRNSITGLTGRAAEADIQGAGPTAGW